MLTTEQKQQFSDILEELSKSLDITKDQHDKAVKSYEFVGTWLAEEDSPLAKYQPEILPQGSFMLGTMIRPVNEDDELDIDLVCRLEGKQPDWTQYDLKKIVGDRLKAHGTIKELLEIPDGRRCWTLDYKRDFHMDVLPSIVSSGYRMVLEKAFSAREFEDFNSLEIRITDNKDLPNYFTQTSPEYWLKSNPFGYGLWFRQRSAVLVEKRVLLSEAVQPVPAYQKEKLPLQRVVQILKRHRDLWADGNEHKPISIIITTLASKAYRQETNIIEALVNIVNTMEDYIEEFNPFTGEKMKWISNPVNKEENFADKWLEVHQKQTNFYNWMEQVKADINNMTLQRGLQMIQESLEKPFGKSVITKTFSNYGDNYLKQRESGALKMAAGTGMLGSTGRTSVTQHTNFGKNE